MKVMLRKSASGPTAYVPKKDLEAPIVEFEFENLLGGWVKLKNGWILDIPETGLSGETALPCTVNAKKRGEDE